MDCKLVEVRDEGTTIICLAIKFQAYSEWDAWALQRCGYGMPHNWSQNEAWDHYTLLIDMTDGHPRAATDPYDWHDRTMHAAHKWFRMAPDAWDQLPYSGAVLDVEYILGEKEQPKASEYQDWLAYRQRKREREAQG
jgi:hypothetical protein